MASSPLIPPPESRSMQAFSLPSLHAPPKIRVHEAQRTSSATVPHDQSVILTILTPAMCTGGLFRSSLRATSTEHVCTLGTPCVRDLLTLGTACKGHNHRNHPTFYLLRCSIQQVLYLFTRCCSISLLPSWLGEAFYNTRFDTDDLISRVSTLFAMVGVAVFAPHSLSSRVLTHYACARVWQVALMIELSKATCAHSSFLMSSFDACYCTHLLVDIFD